MSRGRKRSTNIALRDRRAQRWSAGVMTVVILGVGHSALQGWGNLAWFRLELSEVPLVWWAMSSSVVYWLLGGGFVWGLVVSVLAESARDGDRHRWIWRWGGLGLVAAICMAGSYLASRNGMALYENRIAFRSAVFAPLEVVADRDVAGLAASCEMVRRPRSVRPNDLIDRPTWTLVLRDGRRLRIGGVRGGGFGERSEADRLTAMRRLSDFPIRAGTVSSVCVSRVLERFPLADQGFVRTLFRTAS